MILAAPLWLLGVPVCLGGLLVTGLSAWRRGRSTRVDKSAFRLVSVDHGRVKEIRSVALSGMRMAGCWLGLAFLCLALARPQWGWIQLPRFEQAREVIIALDLSKSMLAEDVRPSRLERARLLVENLLDGLQGERVGLVLFAGTAFTQSPLSSDYEVLREFLPELNTDYLPQGGTDYGAMLRTVDEAFGNDPVQQADRYLIVLSDGESLDEAWKTDLRLLEEKNVRVLSLGVGTEEGAVIPEVGGGLVKDARGSVVFSKLNPETLKSLARRTGGVYRRADNWIDLPGLLRETVESGKKGEFSEQSDRKPVERYQIPLLIGILFLAFSLWREIPVKPKNPSTRMRVSDARSSQGEYGTSSTPPPLPVRTVLLILAGGAVNAWGQPVTRGSAVPSVPVELKALQSTVVDLSSKGSLNAGDYQRLAETTIQVGKAAAGSSLPVGVIEDALDAVFEGESLDPTATDWEALREALENLLKKSKKQQDQKSQNQSQGSQNQSQDSQNQSQDSQNQSQDSQNQSQDSQNQSQDSQNQSQDSQGGNSGQANENNRIGDLDNPENPESGKSVQERQQTGSLKEEETAPQDRPMKTIQGSEVRGNREMSDNPEMAAAMQRMEEIRDRDVPAKLFKALNPQEQRKTGKDW